MDMNLLSTLVNGETLKMFVGTKVRTVVKVHRTEGGVLVGQSTDGHQLTIKGASEGVESHYLEVIGVADSGQSINAEICKDFG
jgi:replication factor A3